MDEGTESLLWEEVTTIILVDQQGVTYRVTKAELVRYLKDQIEEALQALWEALTEEADH